LLFPTGLFLSTYFTSFPIFSLLSLFFPPTNFKDPSKEFYFVFVNSLADVAEVVCKSHEIVIFSYVDCVEISAQHANEHCVSLHQAASVADSPNPQEIVSAFETLSSEIVSFIGAIQQMGIQSTTPRPKQVSLTQLANVLVGLNNSLAENLNTFLRALQDGAARSAVLQTVEQVQEVTREVVEEMEVERARIAELGLFTNFQRVVSTIRQFNSLELEVIEDEHSLIQERGVMARLQAYQALTGYQASAAVLELAKSGDKLGGILEDIQFTLSFQPDNLSSLADSLNIASPTILHLTEPTKTVLAEQATRISQLATTAKEAFTEDIVELEKISALLESVNRGEGTSTVTSPPFLFPFDLFSLAQYHLHLDLGPAQDSGRQQEQNQEDSGAGLHPDQGVRGSPGPTSRSSCPTSP